jgi:hypothetical protein
VQILCTHININDKTIPTETVPGTVGAGDKGESPFKSEFKCDVFDILQERL